MVTSTLCVATLALGSRPRQKGLQGCGPKGSLGVTSETPGSEAEWEGVAPLLWPSVGVKPNTWKSRKSESSGTPECSELDSKAQNTSPWGVLGVIGKVSKCRCPK